MRHQFIFDYKNYFNYVDIVQPRTDFDPTQSNNNQLQSAEFRVNGENNDSVGEIRLANDNELENIMQQRRHIMEHGCKYMDIINYLMTSENTQINQLLKFHQSIYDLNQPLISKLIKRQHCRTAYKNISSIKLGKVSKKITLV